VTDEETIRRAAGALLEAAPPGSEVILFGSHARGKAHAGSDLDFLVVEPEVEDRHGEMVRLRVALDSVIGPLLIAADVLVVSRQRYEHWRDTPSTVYHHAATEGVVYERSA
jgi:predicted nucleotidyltransferase